MKEIIPTVKIINHAGVSSIKDGINHLKDEKIQESTE